ncbi:hypothetical protein NQ315_014831, partial [Exocentrus adspersus]
MYTACPTSAAKSNIYVKMRNIWIFLFRMWSRFYIKNKGYFVWITPIQILIVFLDISLE